MISRLCVLALCAATLMVAQERSVVTFTPAMPKAGGELMIEYHGDAPGAKLTGAAAMDVYILVSRSGEQQPLLLEAPMTRNGVTWEAAVMVPNVSAVLCMVRFRSGDHDDDNGGNVWTVMVADDDGKPVKGANLAHATLLFNGRMNGFRHTVDLAGAGSAAEREKTLYPDNEMVYPFLWRVMMKESPGDEIRKQIAMELKQYRGKFGSDEKAIHTAMRWYEQIGDTAEAMAIREAMMKTSPKGNFVLMVLGEEIRSERDNRKKISLIMSLLDKFTALDNEQYDSYKRMLVASHRTLKEYDNAIRALETMRKPDGMLYNGIAWPLIENGERLEDAVAWAAKGVDLMREAKSQKPPATSGKDWEETWSFNLSSILDTYGYGLIRQGNIGQASKVMAEAYTLSKGEDQDLNTRYVTALIRAGEYDRAIEVSLACVRSGKAGDGLIAQFKDAYVQEHGSDEGYAGILGEAQEVALAELRKKVEESRIAEPSVDFTLKDLNGKSVTLSSLKGKVVVIDFWATWCGPCRASFPYLQKVYEKYATNDNVVILAIDTWERIQGFDAVVENAKKFMKDNAYTFPVLIDEKYVDKYGVEGIPTKFIIDRKGRIAFKSIGFEGPQMFDELTMQIEILLAESLGYRR